MGAATSKWNGDYYKGGANMTTPGTTNRMWRAWDWIFTIVIRLFFRISQWIVHLFLVLVIGSKKGVLVAPSDPILLKTASQLAENIRNQKVKSEDVVKAYVSRIKEVQPHINAVIDERFELALEEARKVDQYILTCGFSAYELARTKPFLGVPFTVKGSLACEGLTFSVGSATRRDLKAEFDAEVIRKLREAGGIPLAMTNLPPLCVGFSSENPLYGITWNPYDLCRLSGGSSGGEAALLAAAGSVIGLANDLGGSLRIPTCLCGVFAHKPTSGTVSSEGFFTLVKNGTEDVLINGPMCRYAEDLLPTFQVMASDYSLPKLNLNRKVELKSLKIYYTDQSINNPALKEVSEDVRNGIAKVIKYFETTHEAKVEVLNLPYLENALDIWRARLSKSSLITDRSRNLSEIVSELLKSSLGCSQETSMSLWNSLNNKLFGKRRERMFPIYRKMGVEIETILRGSLENSNTASIFLFPASSDGAPYRMEEGLAMYTIVYHVLFSALGLPVTQCPLGLNRDGLPIGVQVVGGKYMDRVTIAVANEIANGLGGWIPPWQEKSS